MNDNQQSTPCTGMTCPGTSCGCGCQDITRQVAAEAACACGTRCQCGPNCACAQA